MNKVPASKKYLVAGSIALITFLVYLPSLQNEFVNWDDGGYVYENPQIQNITMRFLGWAFFGFHFGNWHPLTWISHALDYAVWGLNPAGHHLTNTVLHAINTLLVVVLSLTLTGFWGRSRKQSGIEDTFLTERAGLLVAAVTGLLFGIHPLHVESVAWVSERKDLLCGLFSLLSILSYLKFIGAGDKPDREKLTSRFLDNWYLFAFGFFALALLSKPMAVTIPVVLLIIDWYPSRRIQSIRTLKDMTIEKVPFFLLALFSSVMTVLAQTRAMGTLEDFPLWGRVLSGIRALALYLWKMIWPANLIPFYPYPHQQDISFLSLNYLVPALFVVGMTVISINLIKRKKVVAALWGYYVITLLPVLGIIQVGRQAMADRYTYLPSIGPFLALGLAAAWVVGKTGTLKRRGLIKSSMAAGAVAAVLVLCLLTIRQIGLWENSLVLWNSVIDKAPDTAYVAYHNRGTYFEERGEYGKAISDYSMAISLLPTYFDAYNNRGLAYGKTGMLDRSIEDFNTAIAINPNFSMTYNNRGVAYFLKNSYDNAFADFNRSLELNRRNSEAYVNRAYLYLKTGNDGAAKKDLLQGCDLGNMTACKVLQSLLAR